LCPPFSPIFPDALSDPENSSGLRRVFVFIGLIVMFFSAMKVRLKTYIFLFSKELFLPYHGNAYNVKSSIIFLSSQVFPALIKPLEKFFL